FWSQSLCFFFQAEAGIRDRNVTGVQTCALPILSLESDLSTLPEREIWQRIEALLARPENCQRGLFPRISLLEFPDGTRRIGFEKIGRASCRERVKVSEGAGAG